MAVINRVKANERAEESPVRLDNAIAEQIPVFRQTLLELVERFKKFAARDFVWPLARGETCSVNAVVYIVVQKTGELRVLRFDVFWKKIRIFISGKIVEHIVEHAADVVFAIIDDPVRFLVPEHRHGHASLDNSVRLLCKLRSENESR